MNLTAMNMDDLATLQRALDMIRRGAEILSSLPDAGDGALVIEMPPGEPVRIVTGFVMPTAAPAPLAPVPEFELVEPVPFVRAARPVAEAVAAHRAAPVGTGLDAQGKRDPAAVGGADLRPARQNPAADLRTGPLSDAEKSTILQRHAAGITPSMIAIELHRRVQVVSLFLHQHQKSRSAGADAPSAADMSGGPVAAEPSDTGQAPAAAQVPPCAATQPDHVPEVGNMASITAAPRVVVDAPVRPTVQTSPFSVDPRPSRQRLIGVHVDRLKPEGEADAEIDLEIATAIGRGDRIGQIAADLGLDPELVKRRWAVMTDALRDPQRGLSIDDQKFLLIELRRRARGINSTAA